jgi:hypothetical protein
MRSDDNVLMYVGIILLAPHLAPAIGLTGAIILLVMHLLGTGRR